MDQSQKIDKRKFNPGRNGKKNKVTETIQTTPSQETTNTMSETTDLTENNNTTPAETTTTTENQNSGGGEEGLNVEKIQEAIIIDENKLSDKIEQNDINHTPLNEDVVHEDYRNQFAGTFQGRVEEPKFVKPDVNQIHQNLFAPKEEPKSTDTASTDKEKKIDGSNPLSDNKIGQSLKNNFETPDERRQGAELLVDGVLDAYGLLHQLGAWAASVNLERLQEEQLDGKIDLNLAIPVDPNDPNGVTVPLQMFLENYNNECKKTITLDPEFTEKVRPVMIRVCEKNGWGLSDEQYLVYLFGRDLTEKVALIIGMKRAINLSLRMIKKGYAIMKEEQANAFNQSSNKNNGGPITNPRETRTNQSTVTTPTSNSVMGDKKADDAVIVEEIKTAELSLTINKNLPEENIEL